MDGNVMGWRQVWPFPALHVPDYEILYYIRATLLTSEFRIDPLLGDADTTYEVPMVYLGWAT